MRSIPLSCLSVVLLEGRGSADRAADRDVIPCAGLDTKNLQVRRRVAAQLDRRKEREQKRVARHMRAVVAQLNRPRWVARVGNVRDGAERVVRVADRRLCRLRGSGAGKQRRGDDHCNGGCAAGGQFLQVGGHECSFVVWVWPVCSALTPSSGRCLGDFLAANESSQRPEIPLRQPFPDGGTPPHHARATVLSARYAPFSLDTHAKMVSELLTKKEFG